MKTNFLKKSKFSLKAFVLFFILQSSFFISFGQAPEKISYQAVIRDAGNELVSNQQVGMKISILQGSESGTVVYAETHTPTTNANGLVSVIVGNGTVVDGNIATINWGVGTYFLKSETDATGGTTYSIIITNQILSVPYALHAKTVESFTETDPSWSGTNNTDGIIYREGNVGIGTNSPSRKLEVSGSDIIVNNISIGQGSGNISTNTIMGNMAFQNNISGGMNVSFGKESMFSNRGNSRSTAIGYQSMYYVDNRTNGRETYNTALGFESLKGGNNPALNTGRYNTAIGDVALFSITSGNNNTGIGFQVLNLNTSGSENTAVGASALQNNATGEYNTASGSLALQSNISGIRNSATGYQSLKSNTQGSENTGVGVMSLVSNKSGYNNSALGSDALNSNISGFGNSAVGFQSGMTNISGNNNTFIGNKADANSSDLSNVSVLGYNSKATANNQIRLGNNDITSFFCMGAYVGTTTNPPNMTVLQSGQIVRSTAGFPSGNGTQNYLAKWQGSEILTTSLIYDDGTNVGIGTTEPEARFHITNTTDEDKKTLFSFARQSSGSQNFTNIGIVGGASGNSGMGYSCGAVGWANATSSNRAYGVSGILTNNDNPDISSCIPVAVKTGVFGDGSSEGYGGYFLSNSETKYPIYAKNKNADGTGVYGVGNNSSGYYLLAGGGGAFTGTKNGVFGRARNNSGERTAGYFEISNSYGSGFFRVHVCHESSEGTLYKVLGNGSVSTIVQKPSGEQVNMFCPEAPEILLTDYGTGKLSNGKCRIELDPIFSNNIIVDEEHPLRVFIQLKGECKGVYYNNESQSGFDVVELQQGTSDVSFCWSVVANRRDEIAQDGMLISKNQNIRFPLTDKAPEVKEMRNY